MVAVSLRMFLQNLNFQVDVAANGTEAWELIQSQSYEIILSDINLPGLHGKEILKLIKRHGVDVELILFTGYGSVSDAVECMKGGPTTISPSPSIMRDCRSQSGTPWSERPCEMKIRG